MKDSTITINVQEKDAKRDYQIINQLHNMEVTKNINTTLLDEETLKFYQTNKDELNKILNDEGSRFLNTRSKTGYVGLINQAATCYLNSLIQTLFTTPELRRCLYSFRHDPNLHGPAKRSIPLQLQLLFAKLQFGARPAVSTEDLTCSFGWSKSQGATQQDVQELCMVLFDALDRSLAHSEVIAASANSSKDGGGDGVENRTNTRTRITDLFRGLNYNYIRGKEFSGRYHSDPFLTLSLPIKGQKDVIESLKTSFQPDKLDGENQYFCEELDKKIDAEKGSLVDRLPPVLMLHLKRFDFDYQTMRRVKVNDSCEIPEIIDMDNVLNDFRYDKCDDPNNNKDDANTNSENNSNENVSSTMNNRKGGNNKTKQLLGKYQLVSVMNHSGTSRGGHYRAFIRGDRKDNVNKWYDFNDAHVSEMTEKDIDRLFGQNVDDGSDVVDDATKGATGVQVKKMPSNRSSSNAYLLCYRKMIGDDDAKINNIVTASSDEELKLLPENVQKTIEDESAKYLRLRRAYDIKQLLVEMRVFTSGAIGTVQGADLTLDMPSVYTLRQATETVYQKIFNDQNKKVISIDRVRLRKFDAHASAAGKTYGGEESKTLKDLKFGLSCTMMLEVREEDETFEEYNPYEMLVRISTWDIEKQTSNANSSKIVRVEGDQQATVGALRKAVEKATGVEQTKHRLIRMNANSAVVLNDDEKMIKKHFSIWSGEEVIIERVDDANEKESYLTSFNSAIIKTYEDKRNRVSINFNKLGEKMFENCVIIDKRKSLFTLKETIAATLNIEDLNSFRLKLHARAPVLKDLEKSMNDNNLSDGSVVFVDKGVQPKVGDVILLFYRYTPNAKEPFKAISKALFSKDTKVKDVKLRISKHPKSKGHSPEKLRLRIRGKTGKDVGAILRDDQTLGASVKRLSDNDKFAVQYLDTEEVVTSKDAIVSFILWRPIIHKLGKKIEAVVSKHMTTKNLDEKLSNIFSHKFIEEANDGNDTNNTNNEVTKRDFRVAKLRTLGGINAKVIYGRTMSGKGIQWVGLNEDVEDDNSDNMLVMRTDIGRLNDGTNLLIVDKKELNDAIELKIKRDSTPQSPNTGEGNNRPRPPPARNSKFGKGGNGNNIIVFPKRREVGVKIATVFDSPIKKTPDEKKDEEKNDTNIDLTSSTKSVVGTETLEEQRRRLFEKENGNNSNDVNNNTEDDAKKEGVGNLDDSVVIVV